MNSAIKTWIPRIPLPLWLALFAGHFLVVQYYAVQYFSVDGPFSDEWDAPREEKSAGRP